MNARQLASALPVPALALTLLASVSAGGCTTEIGQDEAAQTSCEGASLDANDRCRHANGRFAKAECCAPPAVPSERRTLEAFTCPADDAPIPVAFFDADSTLRVSKSGTPTASGAEDVNVLPFAAAHITDLNAQGYLVAIVSNQGGVAAGMTPYEVAEGGLVYAAAQLTELGAKIDYLDFADQRDQFRKPSTGMATHLEQLLSEQCGNAIDWDGSFMVGDAGYKKDVDGPHPDGRPADDFSNSDRLFAENLDIPFSEPTDYFGWREFGFYNVRYQSQLLGLLAAMDERIAELQASGDDPELLAELEQEVASNRAVNGL